MTSPRAPNRRAEERVADEAAAFERETRDLPRATEPDAQGSLGRREAEKEE